MFIAHEHMLIALIILVLLAIIGMLWTYRAGAIAKGFIEAEKLDFARRTSTHVWIRRKGHPVQKVFIVTKEQLAAMGSGGSNPSVSTFIHPDIGEEHY